MRIRPWAGLWLAICLALLLAAGCSDSVTGNDDGPAGDNPGSGDDPGGDSPVTELAFGINAHLPDDATLDLITAAGIGWVRLSISWAGIEPAKGYRFWDYIDDRVDAAHARGLNILMTISGTPDWASESGQVNDPPQDPSDWQTFMDVAVTRYRDRIHHWGIWNEPNGGGGEYFAGTPEEFRERILLPGARGVKAADSTAYVVAPGVTIHTGWETWMNGIFNQEAKAAVDIVAVHLYVVGDADDLFWMFDDRTVGGDDIAPLETVLHTLGLMDKPIWLEETGWPTGGTRAVTEQQQADYYHDLLWGLHARTLVDVVFPYEMIDDPEATVGSTNFGLLRADYSAKPAYSVYKDFIAEPAPRQTR